MLDIEKNNRYNEGICAHDERLCRICLQNDSQDDMITPCKCKGSSKWVHRACLDQWRATNREAIAFSRCTECLFDYRWEATKSGGRYRLTKRTKYFLFVSRDLCMATVMVQLIICSMGLFVRVVTDSDGQLVEECTSRHCFLGTYYVAGLILFLVCLGIYGLFVLCFNGCSLERSMTVTEERVSRAVPHRLPVTPEEPSAPIQRFEEDGGLDSVIAVTPLVPVVQASVQEPRFLRPERDPYDSRRQTYHRSGYSQRQRQRRSCPECYEGDCTYCPECFDCDCGDCRCHCCPTMHCSGGGGDSNNGCETILVILVVVAVVLGMIGLFVGVFISVVITQQILDRHVLLLHKKRLVKEFRVKDLSGSNDDHLERDSLDSPVLPLPMMEQELPEHDAAHLKKLGLI